MELTNPTDAEMNVLFSVPFEQLTQEQRIAFTAQMHRFDSEFFQHSAMIPTLRKHIVNAVNNYVKNNTRNSCAGLNKVAKGWRNASLSEMILTMQDKEIDGADTVVKTRAKIALNLMYFTLFCMKPQQEKVDAKSAYLKASSYITNIIFAESIRAACIKEANTINIIIKRIKRNFAVSLMKQTGLKIPDAFAMWVNEELEDHLMIALNYTHSDLEALLNSLIQQNQRDIIELINACGFDSAEELLDFGPYLFKMDHALKNMVKYRDKIVNDNTNFVKSCMNKYGKHNYSLEEDVFQECCAYLYSRIHTYMPTLAFTTFADPLCKFQIKEGERLRNPITMPSRVYNARKKVLEAGIGENNEWSLARCREHFKEQHKYTDNELIDIKNGCISTCSTSQDSDGISGDDKLDFFMAEHVEHDEDTVMKMISNNAVLDYFHETQKHSPERFARMVEIMDKANKPTYAFTNDEHELMAKWKERALKKDFLKHYQDYIDN